MKKKQYILMLFIGIFMFAQKTMAACPTLSWWEFPQWSNTSATVKRVNTNSTRPSTIFFCRAADITSAVTTIVFSKTDLMNTQPGKAPGTDSVIFGSGTGTEPLGTGTANLSGTGIIGSYQLKSLQHKIIPTQNMPSAWNEQILFHFYRNYSGNGCQTNRRIRNYLRNHASIFRAGSQQAVSDTTFVYSIARINDVILTHQINPIKIIKGDLEFIWSQNALNNGGCGGSVAGYNHFGVAARLRIKTNADGAAYDIDQAGTYELPNVGVYTQN